MAMGFVSYYSVGGKIMGEQPVGGSRVDYLTDALGSVTATVAQTGAGAASLLNTYQYKPYGQTLAKTGGAPNPAFLWAGANGYRQTGRDYSDVYVRARHYGSQQARWTTKDPIGSSLGEQNYYQYVYNNPVVAIDPLGLWCLHLLFGYCVGTTCSGCDQLFAPPKVLPKGPGPYEPPKIGPYPIGPGLPGGPIANLPNPPSLPPPPKDTTECGKWFSHNWAIVGAGCKLLCEQAYCGPIGSKLVNPLCVLWCDKQCDASIRTAPPKYATCMNSDDCDPNEDKGGKCVQYCYDKCSSRGKCVTDCETACCGSD